ncbi:coiled-coil domain-containing protein 153 [Octopus bimaculoides]|uniref:Dynein regulatory complex protein 12 n=1 Tax=Octopus bimaculoides TaxID=37653 RepID=A0A0L8HZS2_OCTBM|nr:coiled-coil domain-containing protein 153 [Octopus bimaculoides]|eukprot:XP_014768010.1 PREDICTED: coiled-coil domain-containing protein 153-like [Octopus bimaculoides]
MSSKKKSTKTAKKTKKKDGKLEKDEKFQKSLVELNAMKDYIAQRDVMLMESLAAGEERHKELNLLKTDFESQKGDYRSIRADMARQYKTMESEMNARILVLETELTTCQIKLSEKETELVQAKKKAKLLMNQKQEEIEIFQRKNNAMENSYKNILHGALDKLVSKMEISKEQWEKRARMIQAKNKKVFLEFGLNPLDL